MFKLSSANKQSGIKSKDVYSKAIIALIVVCIIWGTTWPASKEGVSHMPALEMAGIRQLISGSLFLAFFFIKGSVFPKWRELGPLFVLAMLNFVLSNGLSTWGLKYLSAGLASIMSAIFPLWLVLIGLFTNSNKMPWKAVVGLLTGFAGVCIIFYEYLADFLNPNFRFGIFLSLVATFTWAVGSLYTKQQAAKFNPYFGLGFQMIIAGVALLGLSAADHSFMPIHAIPWQSWLSIGYLVVFGSVITFTAYVYTLQHLSVEQASIYAYVNPIVALLLSAVLLGEKITPYVIVGGLITLFGVYLVNKSLKAKLAKF
jgi:drug/metabolite transporter (DMT)-like permease